MSDEVKSSIFRVLPFVVAGAVLLILLYKKRIKAESIDLRKPGSWRSFFLWCGFFLVYIFIEELIAFRYGYLVANPWHYGSVATVLRFTGMLVLAPFVEEILFRGLILNMLLKRKLSFLLASFVQSLFFMLSHNTFYDWDATAIYYFVFGLADGMLYAYARRQTASLYTPMVMHMTGNAVAVLERFII